MVNNHIKNFEIINKETPIISVDFDHIPDFTSIFEQQNLQRLNYGDLRVEQGRFVIENAFDSKKLQKWRKEFDHSLEFLSLELLKLDTVRYPIKINLEKWFATRIKKPIGSASNWYLAPVLDRPGFFMPWHLDNRLMIISGIINLDNNECSTIFQKDNKGWGLDDFVGDENRLLYTGKKEKHSGTFWLNTELTWHAVPKVKQDRKILLFNAFFS